MKSLGRILTAMITPFSADGALDVREAVRVAEFLIERGNDGVVVAGSTGEGNALDTDEKLTLFREMAEASIGERHRGAYQKAARHLKRAKALYKRLERQDDWEAYLRDLRARYANLPAFQDELRKARL